MTLQGDGGPDHTHRLRHVEARRRGRCAWATTSPAVPPTWRSRCCSRSVPRSAIRSQAPPGQHTLKIIGMQPYELKEGSQHWDVIKDEVARRQPELAAALCAQPDRRQDPGPRGRKPARSGAPKSAQLARLLPRRRTQRGAGRTRCVPPQDGRSTACPSPAFTRPARPPIRAARFRAVLGEMPLW